ncbi:hypothetical protein [Streptomyces vilmorinianum]|uniref:hypothetical protein n=1 Tax=Streptomyces vilmorinianum TaxID=3051092 RepID=UPI00158628FB|nr:hypothetical protein [Streptomyces vilmorinianum]
MTGLITGSGEKRLVTLTVDTDGDAGDRTDTVTATDRHPFRTIGSGEGPGEWSDAVDLSRGTATQKQVDAVVVAIKADPKVRADMIRVTKGVKEVFESSAKAMKEGRSARSPPSGRTGWATTTSTTRTRGSGAGTTGSWSCRSRRSGVPGPASESACRCTG